MYGKHFQSTYTGSMVGSGPVIFAVWGYVIAHTRDSLVKINPYLLSVIIGCTEKEIEEALEKLCSPDKKSRSKDEEGRRLVKKDEFLYFVPTYEKYHSMRNEDDRRAYMREYMKNYRDKKQSDTSNVNSCKLDVNTSKQCKQKSGNKEKGTRLPKDWVLPKSWGDWALNERPGSSYESIKKLAEKFRDHWVSNSNQAKAKKADWEATWRNWVRNEKTISGNNFPTPSQRRDQVSDKAISEWLGKGNGSIIEGENYDG